jgi:hypothetical protein
MEEDSTSGGGQKVVVLQHLLEDANRMKSQFEKDYLEASQERDILNSDMARIREGIPDALLDQSQNTMSLRLHIIDMEKESKSLRDRNAKLEARIAQGSFSDASIRTWKLVPTNLRSRQRSSYKTSTSFCLKRICCKVKVSSIRTCYSKKNESTGMCHFISILSVSES